ncbi:MAG: rod shape-determining protein MreD [Erythrobacter sp.]
MERLNPAARSDRYGNRINRVTSPLRARTVPYITILLGSLLSVLFLADVIPIFPPLGYLFFLSWRIMRPGLLPLWAGLPLGIFDDLFSGQPFGSAVLLWSITMILLEIIENRFPWRGFYQDWFTASLAIIAYIFAAMVVSGAKLTFPLALAVLPQVAIAIMVYPAVSRIVAGLDRFRLSRSRKIR